MARTEADTLRSWLKKTANCDDVCGCGACSFDPLELDIPPFADRPGESPTPADSKTGYRPKFAISGEAEVTFAWNHGLTWMGMGLDWFAIVYWYLEWNMVDRPDMREKYPKLQICGGAD